MPRLITLAHLFILWHGNDFLYFHMFTKYVVNVTETHNTGSPGAKIGVLMSSSGYIYSTK